MAVGQGGRQQRLGLRGAERPAHADGRRDTIIDITVALNTLGQSLRWTGISGDLLYRQTNNLGRKDATVRVRFRPAPAPMISSFAPANGCTATPIRDCDIQLADGLSMASWARSNSESRPAVAFASAAQRTPVATRGRTMPHQLSDHSRATVLAAARTMFPHDDLPDEAYAGVVNEIDGAAAGDSAVATDIEQGIARLDDPQQFIELDDETRTEALRRTEGSPLFDLIKATAVVALYDSPLVWKAFGYEGPSVHLGGYVDRGFDDLDWLPDPPIALDPAAGSHHE